MAIRPVKVIDPEGLGAGSEHFDKLAVWTCLFSAPTLGMAPARRSVEAQVGL
jgi:hypothetical protein